MVRSHAPIEEDESFDFGRPQRSSLIRAAVAGRGPEFGGIALVCLGVLLAVATYTGGGGPLGSLLEGISSWLIGLGRYVLPFAVIAGGIVSMKRVEVQHKVRLAFGWVVILLGLLGSIHVVMSDGSLGSDLDTFRRGGGAFGWLLGALLERTINNALAVMVLLALVLVGVLITTNSTLPQLVRRIRAWVDGGANPRATRQHGSDDGEEYEHSGSEFYDIELDEPKAKRKRVRKQVVEEPEDVEDELDEYEEEDVKPKRARKARKPLLSQAVAVSDGPTATAIVKAQPQQMPLGPGARASNWVLPTLDMLTVTRHEKADERATEERGDKLVDALKEHNVETEMVGYTRGP
ncbi:MAG: DNA translocase FtsK 4TM domain-containing protein, partial [Ilumatobacteraceae bacterium]|nr:DNA translocase FtsK 4TM domain-containing protein [Ilumatobacteraceae bacterium]